MAALRRLSGLVLLFAAAGVALAPAAAAVDDPTRPDARVTFGPSCRPGGLVIEVTGGTAPYFVRLATTRQSAGEDEARVDPGATVVLRSDDVDWGETIDGRLEYAARDGSGVIFVDELDNYSFTRPTQEDCDAANDPTQPHPSPPASAGPAAEAPSATPSLAPTEPQDTEAAVGPRGPGTSGQASAERVAPGGTLTVEGTGFLPGERVVVQLPDGAVVGSATARPDGSVRAEIRIPQRADTGRTTVSLVGRDSEVVTDVELQVAAATALTEDDGAAALVPLVVAAAALVGTAAGLASVAGRQRHRAGRRGPLRGSA
jgi:hypothetical protein